MRLSEETVRLLHAAVKWDEVAKRFLEDSARLTEKATMFAQRGIETALKVHKNENFFGFDFEFCTISVLVMHE